MLGLRLVDIGIDRQSFQRRFSVDPVDAYTKEIDFLQKLPQEYVSLNCKINDSEIELSEILEDSEIG